MAAEILIHNVVAIFTNQAATEENTNRTRHINIVTDQGEVTSMTLLPYEEQPLLIQSVAGSTYAPSKHKAMILAQDLRLWTTDPTAYMTCLATNPKETKGA